MVETHSDHYKEREESIQYVSVISQFTTVYFSILLAYFKMALKMVGNASLFSIVIGSIS